MPPADVLIVAANAALANPDVRESVRQMHTEKYPLVQMVEALGLDDEMDDRVRQVVAGLAPDVVEGIRAAILAMLDAADDAMPLDCKADLDLDAPVQVKVSPSNGKPTIQVRSVAKA